MKHLIAGVAALLTGGAITPAYAEFTGNVGVTSNYLWRGESQTQDRPAVFGGLDYLHASGLYVGTWSSTIEPRRANNYPPTSDDYDAGLVNQDYQWDLYAGYRHRLAQLVLDAGYRAYLFPRGDRYNPSTGRLEPESANEQDFSELYLGALFDRVQVKYWYSSDYRGSSQSLQYLETNVQFPLGNALSLGVHLGTKKGRPIDDGHHRVTDYHVVLIKDSFRFMVSQMTDNEDGFQSDNPRLSVSWQHEIAL